MNLRQIAEETLGPIDWTDATNGFCECPGKNFHTGANGKRDCKVMLDKVPTITCFHDSCKGEVEAVNHRFRSAIGKAQFSGHHVPAPKPYTPQPKPEVKPKKAKQYAKHTVELPQPMEDATRRFLMAAFSLGEAASVSVGVMNGERRCIPKGGGTTYSREEWIAKLDHVNGDPNKIFESRDLCGAFIRINPMTMGGSKDSDVTAFRHALIEFDHCSIQEQWNIIVQSNIPCTAVLHSGNKSLHAWVKVDAKDRTDYVNRVKVLYDHFKDYGIDEKNKNPSRFSRLPGMLRGKNKQDLLALQIGAESFDKWLIDQETDGCGEVIEIPDLLKFEPQNDPNCILGNRWLCRGGSCLWVGPSGVGKSSLAMQAMLSWAMGRSFFGIYSNKPLKSLLIQAENDLGDLAEMMAGVIQGMRFDSINGPETLKTIQDHIVIVRNQVHTGFEFAQAVQKLIERHKPDLVWLDPLLSFIGDDISSQKVCSQFLRNWMNPISEATGVVWMILHHTGKPVAAKDRKGWTSADYSYLGTGSSELTNWARAVNILRKVDDETFQLMFAKRGGRAGAKDLQKNFTKDVYMRHSQEGICWEQVEPTEEERESKANGRPKQTRDVKDALHLFREPLQYKDALRALAGKFECSERTVERSIWLKIKPLLTYDELDKGWFFSPKN